MTIKQSLSEAIKKLQKFETCRRQGETPPLARGGAALDADVLLSFVLKKPKEFLYTYPEKKLTKNQLARFNRLINRRAKREPVAYSIKKIQPIN